MKRLSITLLVVCSVASAEEVPLKSQFRDAATHEELSISLRKFQQRDPMKNLEAVEGEDPSKVNIPVSILEQSDIISFGGFATLVPKQAIISAPAQFEKYLELKPGTKIIGWLDFYAKNRGWITTVEVSREQAQGYEAIAEATRERISKSANLVVATLMGGPISVFPPQEKKDEQTAETAENSTTTP
ncbi:hypothetical protein [Haloferula sp.]|uniref:hypothetical protein n=1 Tax=Haloferula sp. TaxID=2497595 RepID=UPI003C713EB3